MSINISSNVTRNAQVAPDDADAWRIVLQCAEGQLPFIQLPDTLSTRFGKRFNNQDWSPLFTKLFRAWEVEDEIPSGPVDVVNAAMTSQPTVPASASTHLRQIKQRRVASGAQVSQVEVEDEAPRKTLKTMTTAAAQITAQARRFLDVEAQVDEEDEEMLDDEEDSDPFIILDDVEEDWAMVHPCPHIYSASTQSAGPSRYSQAVHAIAQWYGHSSAELDEGKSDADEDEDEDLAILDIAGIWEKIREWITDEISYETLLRHIDFQYEKYADIQYWEDFVTAIAIKSSVEERKAHFASLTLDQHQRLLSQYTSPVIPRPASPSPSRLSSPAPTSSPLASFQMWAVKIHPVSSAPYIIKCWNQAGLVAVALHKLLPGYVTVYAADPRTFLHALPKSHPTCVKTWILVPLENQTNLFGAAEPSVPGWYTISKRGLYKGNIGYVLSYDSDAGSMELLVASRRLNNPTRQRDDSDIGQDQRARCLFLPDLYSGTSQPPLRGRACHKYKGHIFVAGLLLLKLKRSDVRPSSTPSPHQIALHMESAVNPAFLTASLHRYNQLFWKEGDCVTVCNAAHQGQRGVLHTISFETQSAMVHLLEGGECFVPFSELQRCFSAGDVVQIIDDPHSDIQNIHHRVIGKFGNIISVDVNTDEVTVLDSAGEEIRVPPFLLESYVLDQTIRAAHGSIIPSAQESPNVIEVGDSAHVWSGIHASSQGTVKSVQHATGLIRLRLVCSPYRTPGTIDVPLSSVAFTPPANALRFSAATNYNVRVGNHVVIVRGELIGKTGMVSKVDLDRKTLNVVATWNPLKMFTLPITHFAHDSVVRDRDDENRHRGKEILVIRGEYRGWRGILRLGKKDTCTVELGAATLASLPPDDIVVRQVSHSVLGCDTTLAGTPLTPQESFDVDSVFERGHIKQETRTKTPPPADSPPPDAEDSPIAGTSSNPWRVDDNDVADGCLASNFNFLMRPNVVDSLKIYHAVFKITGGWRASYLDHHVKTEVPSPFQLPSGQPTPSNTLAVILTERTKGAAPLHVNIPENSLAPVAPPKKDTFCMVIESKEGGEEVGTVLSVTKSSKKTQTVEVKHLDGTRSNENILPWSRVIMVERSYTVMLYSRHHIRRQFQWQVDNQVTNECQVDIGKQGRGMSEGGGK
ncbi:hypothetical protein PAXINDRAFT_157857 [Paxillus involutus ATCC 200175]|uniref:KOW domain-containing protein n=1 Tax=Paxillus involutus ATCC 200175 TaxID=664439 RepID=A0A0C9T1L8_PAXIN|nr:hypothetical protein PAXINDRAFT_157857 [Paxillus involutus ATCC 200175]